MDRATPRLIGHLPRFFDHSAARLLVLRVSHPDGFAWRVAGRALTATTELGVPIGAWDLRTMTLAALAAGLVAAGCTVVYSDAGGLWADTLVDGEGRESQSNGDHLYAYTSTLWAILDTYGTELETLELAIGEALLNAYLHTATGEFSEEWGSYFGVLRPQKLVSLAGGNYWTPVTDPEYVAAIVLETTRPRGNPFAVEHAVYQQTGVVCRIRELWQDVFMLDDALADDRYHFYDANFWSWGVIQPVWHVNPVATWLWLVGGYQSGVANIQRALAVIDKNRPAGTVVANAGELVTTDTMLMVSDVGPVAELVEMVTANTLERPITWSQQGAWDSVPWG